MKKINLYYDMDNTLVLWSKHGEDKKAIQNMYKKGYYSSLQPIDNSIKALKYLWKNKKLYNIDNIYILTACIDSKYCKSEKLYSIKKYWHFIPNENIILIENGKNKADYIKDKNSINILIDDYKKNLQDWQIYGNGISVKKRYSNKQGYKYIVRNHFDIINIINEIQAL